MRPAALSPRIKSLNYLNNIMAKIEGQLAGCVEAAEWVRPQASAEANCAAYASPESTSTKA